MGRVQLISRAHLELLRSSAFESEHAWLYDTSYLQHEAAALALEQEIEQSYASISPDENSDEQIRIIKTQITIHRERQKALRPHLESGSDQIDEEGNECVFVPAPNQWGANGDLDEESESLSAIQNLLTWQTSYSPVSYTPLYDLDHLPSPDIPYHSLLDPSQPTSTYHLHRTREWTGSSGFRKYIYTAREYSDKYALYMLETSHRGDSQVNAADFFRVAEYPLPCISILLSGIDKKRISTDSSKDAAYKSRCIHLRGPFSQAIKEYPDRQQKIPWSPRRFTYGGRRFVWKQGDPNDDAMPETLYEYQKDWAKPGSRTGKRCDDAKPIKLVWGEKKKKGKVDSYTIHFRGGMDQVFREILLASQMARQVCLFTAMD
ncbi:Nn.00g055930.m01.CDS01 [Neocucurbitaria sp. VM-36]